MITLQNASALSLSVGTTGGILVFTNAGQWDLASVSSVQSGAVSNYVGELPSGSVVLVDSNGAVSVTRGPDVWEAAEVGFALGVGVLGLMIGVRWALEKMFKPVTALIGD